MGEDSIERPLMLERLRSEIDEVDAEIVRLIHRRAEIVDGVRAAKSLTRTDTYDPVREEEVLTRAIGSVEGTFPPSSLRAVFREIISGCVALQQKLQVGYLGPAGSFTEVAAHAMFGASAELRDVPVASAVIDGVSRGETAYGVVPFESSTDGLILNVVERLVARSLKIRREYVCDISYALASMASSMSEIRAVYAHPLQLDLCRHWLAQHLPDARLTTEESPVASLAHAKADRASAVLISKHAAQRHGLSIVAERANDRLDDAMRFVVVASTSGDDPRADKTAIVVTPREGAALSELLAAFAAHEVELLKLASRPHPTRRWETLYFFEVMGNSVDARVEALVGDLDSRFGGVSVLGSYATHRAVAWSVPPASQADRDE